MQQQQQQQIPQQQQQQQSGVAAPAPVQEQAQPTVRVMRLYKPCLHVVPTLPPLPDQSLSKRSEGLTLGPDFAVSPYLLFPDSFGDIYTGELFSAYIAVVNGVQDAPFHQVSLSIRLQTSNATHDLSDIRPAATPGAPPGTAKILNPNETLDMVVQQELTELGTHTLRVSVQYLNNRSSEPKTLRKFYRFNVLQPLQVASQCCDMHIHHDKLMVQTKVTNTTKSPLFIEDVKFIPAFRDSQVVQVHAPNRYQTLPDVPITTGVESPSSLPHPLSALAHFNLDSLPMLLPDESYAYSFIVSKSLDQGNRVIGVPEIKWCSYMGEHGVIRGEDAGQAASGNGILYMPKSPSLNNNGVPQTPTPEGRSIRIQCLRCPSTATVGIEFPVLVRVTNNTTQAASVLLRSNYGPTGQSSSSSSSMSTPLSPSAQSSSSSSSTAPPSQVFTGTFVEDYGYSLCVTGLASSNIGILGVGESTDVTITVCPLSEGLHELKDIFAVDLSSGREYPSSGALFRIFVYNDDPSQAIEHV